MTIALRKMRGETSGAVAAVSAVEVSDVWARPTPGDVPNAAVYMTIRSAVDDELVAAAVDAEVAASVSLHETTIGGADHDGHASHGDHGEHDGHGGHGSSDSDDIARMAGIDGVALPADEVVGFEPGGRHVMLERLAAPLTAGQRFEPCCHSPFPIR